MECFLYTRHLAEYLPYPTPHASPIGGQLLFTSLFDRGGPRTWAVKRLDVGQPRDLRSGRWFQIPWEPSYSVAQPPTAPDDRSPASPALHEAHQTPTFSAAQTHHFFQLARGNGDRAWWFSWLFLWRPLPTEPAPRPSRQLCRPADKDIESWSSDLPRQGWGSLKHWFGNS